MKEKLKKIILPIGIVLVVVLLAYVTSLVSNKTTVLIKAISFDNYNETFKKSSTSIVFIADSSKSDAKKQKDILNTLAETYYLNIYYLDYSEKNTEYESFLKDEQIETSKDQMILIVKDDKVLAKLEGSNDMATILEFIDDYNKIINKDVIGISVPEYLELIKNDKLKLVYLARPTCEYCVMMTPILKSVMEEYKFNVYYINTGELSEADYNNLIATDESLAEGFGTPTLIYTKDGKFIDVLEGYTEREKLVEFLKVNKVITVEK